MKKLLIPKTQISNDPPNKKIKWIKLNHDYFDPQPHSLSLKVN